MSYSDEEDRSDEDGYSDDFQSDEELDEDKRSPLPRGIPLETSPGGQSDGEPQDGFVENISGKGRRRQAAEWRGKAAPSERVQRTVNGQGEHRTKGRKTHQFASGRRGF